MGSTDTSLPLLVYDGECDFCRFWIDRWRPLTGDRVEYAPFQEVAGRFPEIPRERFEKAVQLILPGGQVCGGAQAVFRLFTYVPGAGRWYWMYEKIPGFSSLSEWLYRLVAKHRNFFSRLVVGLRARRD